MTKQRKILQEYLSTRIDQELSAKEVAEDLVNENVSLSAIYRNLADMEKEQIVVQCHKEGSREFCFRYIAEKVCQESIHLSCRICSKIQHISPEESEQIRETVDKKFQFSLDLPNTVFYGICNHCQNV